MANELLIPYPTGATLYAMLFDSTGQVWNGSAFAAPGSANWTDYDIAMTEVATSTGLYRASMPAAAAGVYSFVVRRQAGASPAVGDITVGSGEIRWTGTAEETVPASANVTYQNGVAVAAADANGNVKAVLYGTQPAVTFGQVKILADVSSQGALHVVNSNADGQGVMYIGGEYGQVNSGVSSNVVGVDAAGIRTAIGLATANLDTQLAALPTDQDVRDAMKLAPTAGDPAAGSMDKHLDDLLTYADAAEPADVWSYVSRTLTATPASTTDGTTAGAITRKRGNSWSIALTLGAITGYTSLWFTIKRSYDDADSASVVQVKLNATGLLDGLLYVNGAAATNDALGGITVSDASTGAIVVALDETVTDDIAPGTYYYDAQALISGAVTTPDSGTFTVTADVTRSVT